MATIDANPGTQANAENQAAENQTAPEEGKKKRGRVAKPKHPAIAEDGGNLEAVPEDYNSSDHAPLKEEDFHENHVDKFYLWQAQRYQKRADSWKGKAENFQKLGGFADKKTAKKLSDSLDEMRELMARLAAQGEDLSAFGDAAKMVGIDLEKKEEAAA